MPSLLEVEMSTSVANMSDLILSANSPMDSEVSTVFSIDIAGNTIHIL
jgi:hypothetical protein